MKYNKEYNLDFPDKIVALGDYDFFYKTYLGTFNSKKVGKAKSKTEINNIPLLGFEIVEVTSKDRYSNSKKETLVIIKHPITGFIFEVSLWDFSKDILLNSKIEEGKILSECVIGFSRNESHYPIRLIPVTSDKYKDAQTLSTLSIPLKRQDLIEGAKYRFGNDNIAVYVGTIPDGAFFKEDIGDAMTLKKIHAQDMLIFQSDDNPNNIYLLNEIDKYSIIETIDISNNIKGLDISLLNCTVLNSLYCKPKEIKVVGDNKTYLIKTDKPLENNGVKSNTTILFLYQESPTEILIVQEFGGEYFNRGKLYISDDNYISFEKFGDPRKYYVELGYHDRSDSKVLKIDSSCPKFKGDRNKLVSVDFNYSPNSIGTCPILYSDLRNNIKLCNSLGKEILVLDYISSSIEEANKINVGIL